MILVFGGSYQEKLNFVKRHFNISDIQVFDCGILDLNVDFIDNKYKVIDNFEDFIYKECKDGKNPEHTFFNIKLPDDIIIICDDLSCGVVPIDKFERLFRETVGRLLCAISNKSSEVYNVLYGIEKKLK